MRDFRVFLSAIGSAGLCVSGAAQKLPPEIKNAFVLQGTSHSSEVVQVDAAGNVYMAGEFSEVYTNGAWTGDFPFASKTKLGGGDGVGVYVAKISASGEQLLYLTEVVTSPNTEGRALSLTGMIVLGDGSVILAGKTNTPDFPTTAGSYQTGSATGGPFVLKLDPSGRQLLFSTFLDGSATLPNSVAVGTDGSIYLAGSTDGHTFPTTAGAYQTNVPQANVGFVCKLSSDGSSLLYSTLFPDGVVRSIAVDAAGAVHLFASKTLPGGVVSTGTFAVLNPAGSALLFERPASATDSLELDKAGNTYLVDRQGTLTIIDPSGAGYTKPIPAMGFHDGLFSPQPQSFAVLDDGSIVLIGEAGPNFPTRNSLQPCVMNLQHDGTPVEWARPSAVLVVLDSAGDVINSSFLGGAATVQYGYDLDWNVFTGIVKDMLPGRVHIIGWSGSANFPGGTSLLPGPLFLPGPVPINLQSFGLTFDLTQLPRGPQPPAPACLAMIPAWGAVEAPLVPAAFMTLFGSNLGPTEGVTSQWDADHPVPVEVGGVSVTVGGLPAPILYAQEGQINFIVPKGVTGPTTQVCATWKGAEGCLFSYVGDSDGLLYPAVVNQDGTVNGPQHQARDGVISLYGIGFGIFDPNVPDGSVTNNALPNSRLFLTPYFTSYNPSRVGPVEVDAYGTVLYLGTAPQSLNGAAQVNIKMPPLSCPCSLYVREGGGTVPAYPSGNGFEVTVY